MPWQWVMLFQNLLAAIFAVNSRTIARRFHRATLPLNLIIYGVITLSGVAYAFDKGITRVSLGAVYHYLGFFLFAGLCFAITNLFSYVVFQYVDAGIASLLATFNTISTVALSTLLIHEGLSVRQIVGAVILLAAMQLVLSVSVSRYRHQRMTQAVLLSVAAAVFYGLATTTEKYLLNHVNLQTYLTFGWGLQFIGVVFVSFILGKRLRGNFQLLKSRRFWWFALAAGVLRMLGGLLYIFSLKLANNLSLVSVVAGLKVILAALLGAVLLKETKFIARKLESAVIAAIGIAVMLWK